MALEGSKAPKFQRMARVLPQNEKSFNLIKEEEAKEAAAREKEQAVSIKCLINLNFSIHSFELVTVKFEF